MSNTNTGGSAFPVPDIDGGAVQEGMALRDYFAAKAMQMMAGHSFERISEDAYKLADAMLKAREK